MQKDRNDKEEIQWFFNPYLYSITPTCWVIIMLLDYNHYMLSHIYQIIMTYLPHLLTPYDNIINCKRPNYWVISLIERVLQMSHTFAESSHKYDL
jgi:hypothetical protein